MVGEPQVLLDPLAEGELPTSERPWAWKVGLWWLQVEAVMVCVVLEEAAGILLEEQAYL